MPRVINQDGWVTSKFTRDSFDGRGWAFKPSGQLCDSQSKNFYTMQKREKHSRQSVKIAITGAKAIFTHSREKKQI